MRIDLGAKRIKNRYIGIACMMVLTRINLLGKFKGRRNQLEILCFIISSSSCEDDFFILPNPGGIPRYLNGKDPSEKPKIHNMFLYVSRELFTKNP